MKSISHGHADRAHQVGHEEHGSLEHADEQELAAGVVGGDLLAELADPRLQASRRRSGPRRRRARARTGSCRIAARVASTPSASTIPGTATHLVAADDERPAFTVGARDLGVDEHVLDLLRAAGEPVAGPPPANHKAWELGADAPPAPLDLAVELDRARARARAGRARAPPGGRRRGRRGARRRGCRAARRAPAASCAASSSDAQDVLAGRRMDPLEQRQDLAADQPARRAGVRRVDPERDAALAAERLGLLAPERQQRPDDAVLAARLDPLRVAARDEPVEDRLDLVARGVPGRAEAARAPARSGGRAARPPSARRRRRARPRRRAPRRRSARRASDSAPRRPWSTWSAEAR